MELTTVAGVFDSLRAWLDTKTEQATYAQVYCDEQEQTYMDATGSVPFFRNSTEEELGDKVYLDPERIDPASMERLKGYYDWYQSKGVRIYLSYACTNLDAVPEEQQSNARAVEDAFAAAVSAMDGPVLISRMEDFFFRNEDFYDTNYHLRSTQTRANTLLWLRDLKAQLEQDGLFAGCPALERLILEHRTKLCAIGDAPFAGVPELRIFVSSEAYHLYRDGDGCEVNPWTAYLDRIYEYG